MSSNDIHGIDKGWSVKTVDRHGIGSVEETTDSYILVKSGLINPEHRYLPAATLEHVRPEQKEIDVSLTQDEVEQGDWSEPPAHGPRTEGAPLNAESDEHAEEIMDTAIPVEPERPAHL
ncbi:MAG: hypothetical protein ACRDGV_11465 [Candidatus Limnocylindria bacterium]